MKIEFLTLKYWKYFRDVFQIRSCHFDSSHTKPYVIVSSLIGLHMGNLRHLRREGSANRFIGPEPVLNILFCHVYRRGVRSCF